MRRSRYDIYDDGQEEEARTARIKGATEDAVLLKECVRPFDLGDDSAEDESLAELLAKLSDDRFVLRQIIAPLHSGKTRLARAYASMPSLGLPVLWLDGSTDQFIELIECGLARILADAVDERRALLVIDDLQPLEEEEAQALSEALDAMIEAGWEALVCCTPSCDMLGAFQHDRVVVGSQDFASVEALSSEEASATDLRLMLESVLAEDLSSDMLDLVLAMLLMGEGSISDLMHLGLRVAADDIRWLGTSFPILGIDTANMSFKTILSENSALEVAFSNVNAGVVRHELVERITQTLGRRSSVQRMFEIVRVFYDPWERVGFTLDHFGMYIDALSHEGAIQTMRKLLTLDLAGDSSKSLHDSGFGEGHSVLAEICMTLYSCSLALCEGDFDRAAIHSLRSISSLSELRQMDAKLTHLESDIADKMEVVLGVVWLLGMTPIPFDARGERRLSQLARIDYVAQRQAVCMFSKALNRMDTKPVYEPSAMLFAQGLVGTRVIKKVASRTFKKLQPALDTAIGYADTRLGLHFICAALVLAKMRGLRPNTYWLDTMRTNIDERIDQAVAAASHHDQEPFTLTLLKADQRFFSALSEEGFDDFTGLSGTLSRPVAWQDMGQQQIPGLVETMGPGPFTVIDSMRIPEVRVNLLGGFEVLVDGKLVDCTDFARRKARELMAILVMREGREMSRDQLAAALWPEAGLSQRTASLYSSWSLLRDAMARATGMPDGPHLVKSGMLYRIDARYVSSDIEEFNILTRQLLRGGMFITGPERYRDAQTSRAQAYKAALEAQARAQGGSDLRLCMFDRVDELYCGELLGSMAHLSFDTRTAEALRERMVEVMFEGVRCANSLGENQRANWYAMRAIEVGGMREEFFRARMQAQLDLGQRTGALDTYFKMQRFLHEHQGLGPSVATEMVYRDIIDDDVERLQEGDVAEPELVDEPERPAKRKRQAL